MNLNYCAMKLYEVLFYDMRDRDRDRDSIFLVRALDMQGAVDQAMTMRRENESVLPHTVFEIGTDLVTENPEYPAFSRVLRGPYYEGGFNFGWREWTRKGLEDGSGNSYEWKETTHQQ